MIATVVSSPGNLQEMLHLYGNISALAFGSLCRGDHLPKWQPAVISLTTHPYVPRNNYWQWSAVFQHYSRLQQCTPCCCSVSKLTLYVCLQQQLEYRNPFHSTWGIMLHPQLVANCLLLTNQLHEAESIRGQ